MHKKPDSTTFVLSDIHHPFQDQPLLDAAEECMRDVKPDCIILNGDIIDCHAISRFVKAVDATNVSFKHEIDVTEAFIKRLRKDHPNATIVYVEGNHEFRIKKLMTEPSQRERWEWLQYYAMLPEILNFKKHDIVYADGGNIGEARIKLEDTRIGHWDVARSKSGQTATSLMDRYGQKTVQGHCFSEDTEVLTQSGWRRIIDLQKNDTVMSYNIETGIGEWNKIRAKFVYDNYDKMVSFESGDCQLLVTDYHTMITKTTDGSISKRTASDLIGRNTNFPACVSNNKPEYPIKDSVLKLLGWAIAEGNYSSDSDGIKIVQSDKPKISHKAITDLCDALGQSYSCTKKYDVGSKQHRDYDAYIIHLHSSDLTRHLKDLAPNKQLQMWMLELSSRQFKLLFDVLTLADGNQNNDSENSYQYSSEHESEIDIMQALCATNSMRTSKVEHVHEKLGKYYVLTANRHTDVNIPEGGKEVIYKGKVSCVTVDNGTLLVRRNGKVAVCGNTHHASIVYKRFGFGTIWGIENPCMCEISDVEYCLDPNWFQGFTILREFKGVMHPQLVVVEQDTRSFIVDGKVYEIKDKKKHKLKTLEVNVK